MSVIASDLVFYASAGMVSGDSDTVGGAIDLTREIIFDDAVLCNSPAASGGDGTLRYVATNDADNGVTVNVRGRNSEGSLVEEAKDVGNSGVDVTGTQVFERILWASLDDHDYDIQVNDSDGNNIFTVGSGVTGIMRPFIGISSDPSENKDFYSKIFLKNNNSTNALLNANIIENADPSTFITFAIEDAVNDNGTSTNRLTAPNAATIGPSGFDSNTKTLAAQTDAGTTDLGAGSGIGVWLKISLPSGQASSKTTYTMQISGSTI